MSEQGIKSYCLGNGERKCDNCGQVKNWDMLNQMPDSLRLALQKTAKRIDGTGCILSGRPHFVLAAK